MSNAVARLNDLGQSPWYDNLTRSLVRDGELAALIANDGIRGVTSNPTIFEKAMAEGIGYDEQLLELADLPIEAIYWKLVETDIAGAADLLRPVYDTTMRRDGFVSVEVSPELAHDSEQTVVQAKELFGRLGRPNVMIKIPATPAGIPAIAEVIASGINVNVTLIFSLQRYEEVIEAFLEGIGRLVSAGGDPSKVASVASFFVSRVDTEVDKLLPDRHELRGKVAVANARLAYRLFEQRFSGVRWDRLAEAGALPQRPLWASTSTKNPAYSDTLYVDELIGYETVNTLAQSSIDALRDHGAPLPGTLTKDVAAAEQILGDLGGLGIEYDEVTAMLERDGVTSFSRSYHDCLGTLERRLAELRPAPTT